MTKSKYELSRRGFLRLGGVGLTATAFGSLLQACAQVVGDGPGGQMLRMWWWGEQEAPGLEAWMNSAIAAYQEETGNTIEATLQDTDVVISEFQTASAANDAPDIQFTWNGIWHMESVWLGYIEPLDDLIDASLLANSNATQLSVFEGKQYRIGWYALPMPWLYNKEMFDQAGLDADSPPRTWDELMAAGEALKSAGHTPISVGLKDGFWGEWYMGHGLGQNLDSPADAINLFIGDWDWRDPKYHEHWTRLDELFKAGMINDDSLSIDLYPGIELYGQENAAMTAVVGTLTPAMEELLGGPEKIGLMVMPAFGTGAMAGRPILDSQGLSISSQSELKETAADFLTFLHRPEFLDALHDDVGILPSDSDWDSSKVTNPVLQQQISDFITADNIAYISNLMPVLFWNDAMFVNSQNIAAGEWDGEQAGENAHQVAQQWREQNPDLVEKYTAWTADFS